MSDPHVVSLRYRVESSKYVSYVDPPAISWDTEVFHATLAEGILLCEMKEHFASVQAARAVIDAMLRGWEIDAAVRRSRDELRFVYEDAVIIDRDPPVAGTVTGVAKLVMGETTMSGRATFHINRATYPTPPTRFNATPNVETMWQRYQGYLDQREPLLSMAYFCLTLIEVDAGGRSAAASKYRVDETVLRKLGELTSTRGDATTARKFTRATNTNPLKGEEIAWIEAAVKALILQVGAVNTSDPTTSLTMSDLPALTPNL